MKVLWKMIDGGKVFLDTEKDELLYADEWETAFDNEIAIELRVHRTKRGQKIYYLVGWDLFRGEIYDIDILPEKKAMAFLAEKKSCECVEEDGT